MSSDPALQYLGIDFGTSNSYFALCNVMAQGKTEPKTLAFGGSKLAGNLCFVDSLATGWRGCTGQINRRECRDYLGDEFREREKDMPPRRKLQTGPRRVVNR